MPIIMRFEDYPRKVYKRTFLNTVFVLLSYSVEDLSVQFIAELNQFLRDIFDIQEDVSEETFKNGFSIDNEEKGISYFFSAEHLGVKYMKDDYVSFPQTMMPLIYPIMSFLNNVMSNKIIEDIGIKKVNIWNAKLNQDKAFNEIRFAGDFLSADLITQAKAIDSEKSRDTHCFVGETESFEFIVQYGFIDREFEDDKYCGLVLDECVKATKVPVEEVERVLLKENNTLYNIFHWSVSKKTLDYMNMEV